MHGTVGQIPGVSTSPQVHQQHCILGTLSYQPADGAFRAVHEAHNTCACAYTPIWKDKIPQSTYTHT